MKLSAHEEYSLRCLLQIACKEDGLGTIPQVAAEEGLTEAYVAKLLRGLRHAGLVVSSRGAGGGYRLARPAKKMRLGDVIMAIDRQGSCEKSCCQFCGASDECVHADDCSVRALWVSMGKMFNSFLNEFSLEDLVCKEVQMKKKLKAVMGKVPVATLVARGA